MLLLGQADRQVVGGFLRGGEHQRLVQRDVAQQAVDVLVSGEAPAAEAPAAAPAAEPAPQQEAAVPEEENLHAIVSPIVGTFYRAPNPDADPYVKVGDFVEQGQTLCIVEAMKLMNEIECDISGTIVRVLPENAQPIEYGENLFMVRPT